MSRTHWQLSVCLCLAVQLEWSGVQTCMRMWGGWDSAVVLAYPHACMYAYAWVHELVCVCMCGHTCMRAWVCSCMSEHVCLYVWMYVCMYVCI